MTRSRTAILSLLLTGAFGCRSNVPSGAESSPRNSPAPSSASAPVPSSTGVASTAASAPAALPFIPPQLKTVIAKPFPEGAEESVTCEAIDSKETDLWQRFGHILPVYDQGAVYVLESGPKNKQKLYDYIAKQYVYRYDSRQASCRGELTLLYIRNMYESSEFNGKPFGREHLRRELETKLGIKTRESFLFAPDEKRLAEYCRTDAELCDKLIRLFSGWSEEGLCVPAVSRCKTYDSQKDNAALYAACRQVPRASLACLYYKGTNREQVACRDQINALICPE